MLNFGNFAVIGCSLPWCSTRRPNEGLHGFGRSFLAMRGTRSPGDRLIHQGSTQVIDAGVEASLDPLVPKFRPRGLNVLEYWVQR